MMKFDQLKPEVQLFFSSPLSGRFIKQTAKNQKIKFSLLDQLITFLAVSDFDIIALYGEMVRKYKFNENQAKNILSAIVGDVIFPLIDFLPKGKILSQTEKLSLNIRKNGLNVDLFKLEIEKATNKILEDLLKKREENFDVEEEQRAAEDLFSSGLKNLLANSDRDAVNDLNGGLICLLNLKPEAKTDLLKTLSENDESASRNNIIVGATTERPTFSNWLKDFIRLNGTDIFNNLTLTEYLTNSKNGKLLQDDEKLLMAKFFILYRNLKFFPDSLSGVNPDKWEIVPVNQVTTKSRAIQNIPGPEQNKKLRELREIAAQFAPGSLERRAVEDEIRKLGN